MNCGNENFEVCALHVQTCLGVELEVEALLLQAALKCLPHLSILHRNADLSTGPACTGPKADPHCSELGSGGVHMLAQIACMPSTTNGMQKYSAGIRSESQLNISDATGSAPSTQLQADAQCI